MESQQPLTRSPKGDSSMRGASREPSGASASPASRPKSGCRPSTVMVMR
ncbi:MAG: hypothetical protein IJT98_04240 [Prevotella sp.]|nr:hypothetical protein [Prevotella sp.]